jgi:hypothetical protein
MILVCIANLQFSDSSTHAASVISRCDNHQGDQDAMNKRMLISTAAAVFAATTFVAASASAQIKCTGANACKGQSACKSGNHSCKGQNACKGQGFVNTRSTLECNALKAK